MEITLEEKLSENKGLKTGLDAIKKAVKPLLAEPNHIYFTNHNMDHSERIIKKCDMLISSFREKVVSLNSDECFILMAAAYLHDIGMQYSKINDLQTIRDKHHELTVEMIERNAAGDSTFPNLGLYEGEHVGYISLVCKGHRNCIDLQDSVYDSDLNKRGDKSLIRLRLLTALLRLGDTLDLDSSRVDMEVYKIKIDMPVESQFEWWKHYYVQGLVVKDGLIWIQYRFPGSMKGSKFEKAIDTLVQQHISKSYKSAENVFHEVGIILIHKSSKMRYLSDSEVKMAPVEITKKLIEAASKIASAWRCLNWSRFVSLCFSKNGKDINNSLGNIYDNQLYASREIEAKFKKFVKSNKNCFIVVGKAGTGKTNLLCKLTEVYNPSIFINISHVIDDINYIEKQMFDNLKELLGVNSDMTLDDMIDVISELVKSQGKYFIVFLDGSYNVEDMVGHAEVLYAFLAKYKETAFKFCLSCRGSNRGCFKGNRWEEIVCEDLYDEDEGIMFGVMLDDFTEIEFQEACPRYFRRYKIDLKTGEEGSIEGEAKERLKHPLLLRLYSEARENYSNGPERELRLIRLCKDYKDKKIYKVGKSLEIGNVESESILMAFLFDIARLMRDNWASLLEFGQIEELPSYNKNLFDCVLSENILIQGSNIGDKRKFKFMFNELSEYLLAQHVIEGEGNWRKATNQYILNNIDKIILDTEQFKFVMGYGLLEFCILLIEEEGIGDANLPIKILNKLLHEEPFRWRRVICRVIPKLNKLDDKKRELINILGSLVNDKEPLVRMELAEGLSEVARTFPKESLSMLKMLSLHLDERVKVAACKSLLRLDEKYIEDVANCLIEAANDYRWTVCEALANNFSETRFANLQPFVPILKKLSVHSHYRVKTALATTIRKIGSCIIDDAIEILTEMCKGRDDPHKRKCIESLSMLSPCALGKIVGVFNGLSKSGSSEVRIAVGRYVGRVDMSIAREVWVDLSSDREISVRVAVWEGLVESGEVDRDDKEVMRDIFEGNGYSLFRRKIFQFVEKRDGTKVAFDISKITNAIFEAAKAAGGSDIKKAESLAYKVIEYLYREYGEHIPKVEEIQDAVEKVLIHSGHAKTAKEFILYRDKKAALRKDGNVT